jgi:UDP-N-acetylmuramate--alanine ligase
MINAKNVHIIGIGGIGTSAVAKWFKMHGASVSGSDMRDSDIIQELDKDGIQVKIGHFADNIPRGCDLVVYSSAVPATNVERMVVAERDIPNMSFSEFLGTLSKEMKTIAVSGTNGKSTTTAMIAKIFIDAGMKPSVILGTKSPDLTSGNVMVGKGDWMIMEACEHMANMLKIRPEIAVITNIEEDHLDFYRDLDHIRETFQEWIDCKDSCGQVILNKSDPESMKLDAKYKAYYNVENRRVEKGRQIFDVAGVEVSLKIPGEFNAFNAAAALTAAHTAGVDDDVAVKSLSEFSGTWRRFEHIGLWEGADVYSDYAHHPTAVKGSLRAFKEFFPDRRIVLVFQPHQYSRTHELFNDFLESFDDADVLILSEVYEVEGREEEIHEDSEDMVFMLNPHRSGREAMYGADLDATEAHLRAVVKKDDVVILMGAGDIDSLARKLV